MEKNTNANAKADTNAVAPETSPDHHGRERCPVSTSPRPPPRNDDSTNPTSTPTVMIVELPSSSDVGATGDIRRRQTVDATTVDVGTSSHEQVGGGAPDAAATEQAAGKKRGRGGDGGEQQQVVKAAKKKGELTEVPKGEPKCATCNKVFKSWKALFGHLRSHPERTYRGALPPPTAAELDIRRCQQQLASTLLTVAQEVAATTTASTSRRGLEIDLNIQPSSDDGGSPDNTGSGVGFDLNIEPPPESDDED